jgi:hypothetical protein
MNCVLQEFFAVVACSCRWMICFHCLLETQSAMADTSNPLVHCDQNALKFRQGKLYKSMGECIWSNVRRKFQNENGWRCHLPPKQSHLWGKRHRRRQKEQSFALDRTNSAIWLQPEDWNFLSLSHCHSWLFPLMERIWTMMQNVLLPNTFGSFTWFCCHCSKEEVKNYAVKKCNLCCWLKGW